MNKQPSSLHRSVMLEECVAFFSACNVKTFFEGTVGAGGHAAALLQAHPEIERYIACDRDPEALKIARETLKQWSNKVEFVEANFADLDQCLSERNIHTVDGFFLTLECHLCS